MASLKFRLKGTSKKELSIYLRLSISRNHLLEVKTGFNIHPDSWSEVTKMPKQSNPELKNLFNDLKKLESFVYESLNLAQAKGTLVDKIWLEGIIHHCFNRPKNIDEYGITDHVQHIIDNATTRKVKGKTTLGLSEGRIKTYKSFKKNIVEFEKVNRTKLLFADLSPIVIEKFKLWLLNKKSFSMNYAGKQLDNIRAVANDANRMGFQVNPYVKKLESFSESDDDRFIVTLTFDDLEKIKNTKMNSEYLDNAKKWLLFGCEIGQRGGDLLSINENNLRQVDNHLFVDVIQQKTKREVTIPIASMEIRSILEKDFPRPISQQKLNTYIKEVCKKAGIDEIIEGKIFNNELKRKVKGSFPKYELVTTHSFRRSFSTNYYKKIATPILMTITGHSKESMFLKYINRQEDKDDNARLFLQYYSKLEN